MKHIGKKYKRSQAKKSVRRVKDRFHLIKYLFICLNFERCRTYTKANKILRLGVILIGALLFNAREQLLAHKYLASDLL